jgi:hypothetical protein
MAQHHTEMLLLTDQDGNGYLLSRETLEASRIPEERTNELLKATDGDDVAGFAALGASLSPSITPSVATLNLHKIVLYPGPGIPGPGPVAGQTGPSIGGVNELGGLDRG